MTNKEHKCICGKPDWDVVVLGFMIIVMAITISIWQDNPRYLWLLALFLGLSSEKCKATSHKEEV